MAKHYVQHRDVKGTLARVERNVRIAQHCGLRMSKIVTGDPYSFDPRSLELLHLFSAEERQARGELSPGLWVKSFTDGWCGVNGG